MADKNTKDDQTAAREASLSAPAGSRLKTCKRCDHLRSMRVMPNDKALIFYCGETEAIIPGESKDGTMTFWRVPENCPRPDSEVEKSDTPQPKREWEILNYHSENRAVLTRSKAES